MTIPQTDLSRDPYVYVIHLGDNVYPDDLVTQMTHAVWDELTAEEEFTNVHRWSTLYKLLRGELEDKLTYHKGCGEQDVCRGFIPTVFWTSPGRKRAGIRYSADSRRFYLLTLPMHIEDFIEALSVKVTGRFWDPDLSRFGERMMMQNHVGVAVRGVLAPYALHNDKCMTCALRTSPAEEGIWNLKW